MEKARKQKRGVYVKKGFSVENSGFPVENSLRNIKLGAHLSSGVAPLMTPLAKRAWGVVGGRDIKKVKTFPVFTAFS